MIVPDKLEFTRFASRYNLIPVWSEMETDLDTPLTIFQKVGASILLESVESGENVGRYSILGIGKKARIELTDMTIRLTEYKEDEPITRERQEVCGDPLDFLRRYFSGFRFPRHPVPPVFFGGGIGFLGYECIRYFENIKVQSNRSGLPDALVVVPRVVLVYDSVKRSTTVVVPVTPGDHPPADYRYACQAIGKIRSKIRGPANIPKQESPVGIPTRISRTPGPEVFRRAAGSCLDYIRQGEIIQAVLSVRMRFSMRKDPFDLYRRLRILNPSPYLFYLDFEEFKIIGSSPEVMVRVQENELLLKPIAGTRPRGQTLEGDHRLARQLADDPKEKAEHIMLVDLGRNDLGRVAVPGSVRVAGYMDIERYSHVMHIVSTIQGRLDPEKDVFDVIRATFPAGTVTGAPKIRAMEIISKLESRRRGPYGGMIFNLGYDRRFDSCITIRTMVVEGNRVTVQAGAGIVADSDPDREYREIQNKAEVLFEAAAPGAGEGSRP